MPTFHLVVDEVVPVHKFEFRVRMWRQAGFPPLVLSSQVRGHPPPDWCSNLLGNLVLGNFLGYALPIPVFFELSVLSETTRAFRVRFETIGCDLRPILHKPSYTPLKPSAVEQLFGVTLDILRTRGISRCSAAPIAKLARLGELQFHQWRYTASASGRSTPSSRAVNKGSCPMTVTMPCGRN